MDTIAPQDIMCPQHEKVDVCARAEALVDDLLRDEEMAQACDDYLALKRSQGRGDNAINHLWREKVTEWCYKVVDYIGEDREVVHDCMNVLDRFLAASDSSRDRTTDPHAYQAAAMTALLLTVKSRGRVSFGAKDLLQMSRGNVSPQEIASTAKEMGKCLSWQHCPPAPSAFVRIFLDLLPREDLGHVAWSSLLDSATYLVEVSVCDSYFSGKEASAVAYAAIHYAINSEIPCTKISSTSRARFFDRVESLTGLCRNSTSIHNLYSRLHSVYSQSSDSEDVSSPQTTTPVVIPCDSEEEEDNIKSRPLSATAPVVSYEDVSVVSNVRPQDEDTTPVIRGMRRIPAYTSLQTPAKKMRLCA